MPGIPVLLALLLVLYASHVPPVLHSLTHTFATPVWELSATITNALENETVLISKEELQRENTALREENAALKRTTFTTRSLARDNEYLRDIIANASEEALQITATVIHDSALSPYDTFIIDRGDTDGLRDGMLVVTPEGIAVGYISATHAHTSTVTLFSAPRLQYDAVLHASSTSLHADISGHGAHTMKTTVPRDVQIDINDTVALPTFETYTLGTITSIKVSPEDAFKTVFIKTPVNTYELRYVLVDTASVWKIPKETLPETALEVTP